MHKSVFLCVFVCLFMQNQANANVEAFCRKAKSWASDSQLAISNQGQISNHSYEETGSINENYYHGCRYDIPWMQRVRTLLCDNPQRVQSSINLPSHFYFIFDGAGDFNANWASPYADNLDGSEGSDMGMGNFNGGGVFLPLIEKFSKEHNHNRMVLYYASSGVHQRENYQTAKACAEEVKYYTDTLEAEGFLSKKPKWITLGFSNGGQLAVDFQDFVGDSLEQKLDLVFTVDPIIQAAFYMFKGLFNYAGTRNENTLRFINYYQTDDVDSLPPLELRGKPVKNADENIHLSHKNSSDLSRSGRYNHLYIVRSKEVKSHLECELEFAGECSLKL